MKTQLRPGLLLTHGSTGCVLLTVYGEAILLSAQEARDLALALDIEAYKADADEAVAEHTIAGEAGPDV